MSKYLLGSVDVIPQSSIQVKLASQKRLKRPRQCDFNIKEKVNAGYGHIEIKGLYMSSCRFTIPEAYLGVSASR